ncbi:YncE family protein [Arboricoccus pini]|uniref:YncE family protein n=1 Tax=Arboricoccus pini TaxID=1963835 RepID=UPI0013FD2BED|nr:YncE family protein [Arboricoccus pini]
MLPHPVLGGVPSSSGILYAISQDAAAISVIDSRTRQVRQTFATDPGPARAVHLGEDRLVLSHPEAQALSVLDLRDGRTIERVRLKGEPFGLTVHDGDLFATNWSEGTVVRIDGEALTIEGEVAVGKSPSDLVAAHGQLYVTDREMDRVCRIDIERMVVTGSVAVGRAPFAIALAPDGLRLYVANVRSASLSIIQAADLKPVATVAVGQMPYGVAVTPDGALILVVNQQSGNVSFIDALSLTPHANVKVGRYPEGIAITADGLTAWIANWFSADVSLVSILETRELVRLKVGDGVRAVVAG